MRLTSENRLLGICLVPLQARAHAEELVERDGPSRVVVTRPLRYLGALPDVESATRRHDTDAGSW